MADADGAGGGDLLAQLYGADVVKAEYATVKSTCSEGRAAHASATAQQSRCGAGEERD